MTNDATKAILELRNAVLANTVMQIMIARGYFTADLPFEGHSEMGIERCLKEALLHEQRVSDAQGKATARPVDDKP